MIISSITLKKKNFNINYVIKSEIDYHERYSNKTVNNIKKTLDKLNNPLINWFLKIIKWITRV